MRSQFDTMYTSSMNDMEKEAFHIIVEKTERGHDTVRIPRIDPASVVKVMTAVMMSSLSFCNEFGNGYSIADYKKHYEIVFSHLHTPSVGRNYKRRFETRVESIVKKILSCCSTDYEKVLMIHDEVLKGVVYSTVRTEVHPNIYNAYAPLVDKVAACQGVALAFSTIAREVGVDCANLANDGMNHCWNMVRIDESYCNVDATWDIGDGKNTYDYLNLSDRRFMLDHLCKLGPVCDTDRYDWYRMNDLCFHDLADIHDFLVDSVREGKRTTAFEYGRLSTSDIETMIADVMNISFRIKGTRYQINNKIHVAHVTYE